MAALIIRGVFGCGFDETGAERLFCGCDFFAQLFPENWPLILKAHRNKMNK